MTLLGLCDAGITSSSQNHLGQWNIAPEGDNEEVCPIARYGKLTLECEQTLHTRYLLKIRISPVFTGCMGCIDLTGQCRFVSQFVQNTETFTRS